MPRLVLITGGFDPVHSGHIEYINAARALGDYLFVGLNSDEWLTRKKGKPFMPWTERHIILANLRSVDDVFAFDDSDNSAIDAIRRIREENPGHRILFANGGDRTKENIPEMAFEDEDLEFVFGVGGQNKKNSSSWILENSGKEMKTFKQYITEKMIKTQHHTEKMMSDSNKEIGKIKNQNTHFTTSRKKNKHIVKKKHKTRDDAIAYLKSLQEGNPLSRINKSVEDDRHFVGMSAERSHLSPEENKKRMKDLHKRVRAAGYGFRKTRGKWEGGSESSIVVHANKPGTEHGKKLKQDMKRIASDFDQDAVFYHSGKEGKLIGTNKTGYPGKGKVEKVGKVRYNRDAAPFQTQFKKGQTFTTSE